MSAAVTFDPDVPGRTMTALNLRLLEEATAFLARTEGLGALGAVFEWRSRAEAIVDYMRRNKVGKDAELAALEVVRRAERRIGLIIREGQANGDILTAGEARSRGGRARVLNAGHELRKPIPVVDKPTVTDLFGRGGDFSEILHGLAAEGVTDDAFEEAIAQGKAEGNLSRTSMLRRLKRPVSEQIAAAARAHPMRPTREMRAVLIRDLAEENLTSNQIGERLGLHVDTVRKMAREFGFEITADRVFAAGVRDVDPNHVLEQIVAGFEVSPTALAFLEYGALERDRLEGWIGDLSAAIRTLQTIKRNLIKESDR